MAEAPQTPVLPSEGDYIVLRLNVSATRAMFGVRQYNVPQSAQPYVGYLHEVCAHITRRTFEAHDA
jgi:hypothetical protein